MEHHYTKSFGHPDIKFYPPPPTFMQMNLPVTGNITFFMIIIIGLADGPPTKRPYPANQAQVYRALLH